MHGHKECVRVLHASTFCCSERSLYGITDRCTCHSNPSTREKRKKTEPNSILFASLHHIFFSSLVRFVRARAECVRVMFQKAFPSYLLRPFGKSRFPTSPPPVPLPNHFYECERVNKILKISRFMFTCLRRAQMHFRSAVAHRFA